MEVDLLLHGVLWPSALAVAVVLASRSLRPRLVGLAIALAFVVSAGAQDQLVTMPAIGSWTWIPIAVAFAAATGAAAGEHGGGRIGRAAACVVSGLLAALLLPLPEWRSDEARLALAGGIALQSALMVPLGMHRGGFSSWLAWSVALVGSSGVALATGFAKLAVPCGAASFVCGCMGLMALGQRPNRILHAGIGGAIVIASCATLGAAGAFAFETGGAPKACFLLAGIAPVGAWLGEAPPFRGSRTASALARVLGTGAIAGAAVWMAASHRVPMNDAYAAHGATRPVHSLVRASR